MRNKKASITTLATAALLAVSITLTPSLSADHHEGEELDLSKIMKEGHKGKTSLSAKVKRGEASETELKELIGFYLAMEKMTPPMGDKDSWKAKTAKLVSTSINVFAKTDGALDAYSEAVNCKACHKVHKED
jgi:hypothetical protein